MRKLASIQRIVDIQPIDGADRIVRATVLGWHCVTQKSNDFKPGDLVVYFEPDAMLPAVPAFEFLRKKPEETSFRLKTIRLKGQVSQGLILPLDAVFSKSVNQISGHVDYHHFLEDGKVIVVNTQEGVDLSELLGITKYEPEVPAQLRGLVKGNFPHFLAKTDETRIQSCPKVLVRNQGKRVYTTEKIDGSSWTGFFIPDQELANELHVKPEDLAEDGTLFGVCSRNLYLTKTEGNAYWKMVEKYDIENKLRKLGRPLALQGEMYGLGICGNKLKETSIHLKIYNVKDLKENRYLSIDEMVKVCVELGLETVPILDQFVLDHTVDELVVMSIGKSVLNDTVWREGIVVRGVEEGTDEDLGRFSFKVINPEFLLEYKE